MTGFWRDFWRVLRREGKRTLLAYPLVFLSTLLVLLTLFPDPDGSSVDFWLAACLVGVLLWPLAGWVVDRTVLRRRRPRERP